MDYVDLLAAPLGYEQDSKYMITYMESFAPRHFGIRMFSKYVIVLITILFSNKLLEKKRKLQVELG